MDDFDYEKSLLNSTTKQSVVVAPAGDNHSEIIRAQCAQKDLVTYLYEDEKERQTITDIVSAFRFLENFWHKI